LRRRSLPRDIDDSEACLRAMYTIKILQALSRYTCPALGSGSLQSATVSCFARSLPMSRHTMQRARLFAGLSMLQPLQPSNGSPAVLRSDVPDQIRRPLGSERLSQFPPFPFDDPFPLLFLLLGPA
jgi:hypothetical protein